MYIFIPLVSGFVLGCLHAFDADHLAAVSAVASGRRSPASALRLGAAWGLGHSAVLLVAGGLIVGFNIVIPAALQEWTEIAVGLMLIGLGAWTIRRVLNHRHIHIHRHVHNGTEHVHFHRHDSANEGSHDHRHSMFAIGAAHGLAGTGTIVLLIPIALANSPVAALSFLLVFGLGTMIAMSAFSLFFTLVVNTVSSERLLASVQGAAGLASMIVGLMWITIRLT
ncbi:MAG: hypothetical protein A2X67_06455 [Ignavibacteria bacterium GWA2_55_11]|nr:MAG: hypothetical protein A2X67_06455 [Ignavibacteria bacterium GWA2_55_11]OGU44101.1 MAG: hypothetical protein A2X68_09520 [Ignavibacteria bacterium GWC2_56_12]OGU73999.1 MAG: hypothetical protein A3H45_15230 [Ignavibacteria bacterium RIFCSPLOWO2_02_FULL_55_14]OGU75515.1 MAG: hypothetical protein A3G43_14170 [Ignavibacteria bacterium RIFCSPLOWO2_12_FULL_56_21]HAV24352.1 urease accessory protein [Bacteroidota bacterium]